jgi:hypothetical protein
MDEQFAQSINRPITDLRLRRQLFIRRMQRKLAIKQATYSDGEDHRFPSKSLSLPIDFSI